MAPARRLDATIVVGLLFLGGCGLAREEPSLAPDAQPNRSAEASRLIQSGVELALPGTRVTLLRFPRVGRLVATCAERPSVAFEVESATQMVGVDSDHGAARVRRVDPDRRLRGRLPSAGLQRWHIASRHGDGDRIVTASVQVAPVIGGRGSCQFSAQSVRTGRIP